MNQQMRDCKRETTLTLGDADWVILYATYPYIWRLDVFGCGGYGVSLDVRIRGIFLGSSSSGSTI